MGKDTLEQYMKVAIGEAEQSLRESNYGFGAAHARQWRRDR